jgi:hypothetical protein
MRSLKLIPKYTHLLASFFTQLAQTLLKLCLLRSQLLIDEAKRKTSDVRSCQASLAGSCSDIFMQFLDEISHNKYYFSVIMPTGCDPPRSAADCSPLVLTVGLEWSLCLVARRRRSMSHRGPSAQRGFLFGIRYLQAPYSRAISCFRGR